MLIFHQNFKKNTGTGRAGAKGTAITFFTDKESGRARELKKNSRNF
jgi:superfamily II DNA/RNA helicase